MNHYSQKLHTFVKNTIILSFFMSLAFLQTTQAQSQLEAENLIQEAREKLIEVIILLEQAYLQNIEIKASVLVADNVLDIIKEADLAFQDGNYTTAIGKANLAISQLNELTDDINNLIDTKRNNKKIINTIIGVCGGAALVFLGIITKKKIYPWYKEKQQEEYGKLQIIYPDTEVKKANEKN